jgi:hypothetical protein
MEKPGEMNLVSWRAELLWLMASAFSPRDAAGSVARFRRIFSRTRDVPKVTVLAKFDMMCPFASETGCQRFLCGQGRARSVTVCSLFRSISGRDRYDHASATESPEQKKNSPADSGPGEVR